MAEIVALDVFDTEERPLSEALALAATLRQTGKYGRVAVRKSGMGYVKGELVPFARIFVERQAALSKTGKNSHRR